MFRIGLTSAVQGLRMYHATALLLGLALLGATCSIVPLANAFGRPDDWLGFRQSLHPIPGGDLGLPWLRGVASPSAAQQEAVFTLGALLLYTMWGTVLVAMVTVLMLGAARASERRAERVIRRAVGASRRTSMTAALAEVVMIAAIPAGVGSVIGLYVSQFVAASWPGNVVPGSGTATSIAVILLLVVFAGVLVIPAVARPRHIGEAEMQRALPTIPVVFQIAVCFTVLCTGSLLTSRAKELWIPSLPEASDGTVAAISVDSATPQERSARFQRLLEGLPSAGIHSASLSSPGTLSGLGHVAMVLTDCGRCSEGGLQIPFRLKPATHKIVSADTFRLTGLPVLAGRGITSADDWDAPRGSPS
ncbi:MAG: FtsX-like permease family protein [Gemmatimonadales bacterium]